MLEEPDEIPSPDTPSPGSDAAVRAEASIFRVFVIVRTFVLMVCGVSAVTAWRSYRRPRLMLTALAVTAVESGWLVRRCAARGAVDGPFEAWVDGAAGVVGLVALAGATTVQDRTTWVNWMSPMTYTTVGGLAICSDAGPGAGGVAVLGATYLATTASSIRRGGSAASTAMANTLSYGGFFFGANLVVRHLRRSAVELQGARVAAVESAEQLAGERERSRQFRLVHDSALQTLEAVAAGWGTGTDPMLQARAREEWARLRAALVGDDVAVAGLAAGLGVLADEFRAQGLEVALEVGELGGDLALAATAALCDAASEAVRNVAKHAGVPRVEVRAVADAAAVTVMIRDSGAGFDVSGPTARFGVAHSIVGRMRDVGGDAHIVSAPGRGTLVTLRFPRGANR